MELCRTQHSCQYVQLKQLLTYSFWLHVPVSGSVWHILLSNQDFLARGACLQQISLLDQRLTTTLSGRDAHLAPTIFCKENCRGTYGSSQWLEKGKGHIAFISDYGCNIIKELSQVDQGRGAMQMRGAGPGGECSTLGEKTAGGLRA